MRIVRKSEGTLYTPPGHDAEVSSRKLFNPEAGCMKMDVHVTTFAPGAGMDEESHQDSDHVFFMLAGALELVRAGEPAGSLQAGDAVFIPAGELHQLRNPGNADAVFLAVTTLPGGRRR